MSSLALLNKEGVVARKLQLVSLPDDYVVPEGMTVSWRTGIHVSSRDSLDALRPPREPMEAYFYLGSARGQVSRDNFKRYETDRRLGPAHYASRDLTITVQGTLAGDVMRLRDHILHLINSHTPWEVSNDLNPKPKSRVRFLSRLFRMFK